MDEKMKNRLLGFLFFSMSLLALIIAKDFFGWDHFTRTEAVGLATYGLAIVIYFEQK